MKKKGCVWVPLEPEMAMLNFRGKFAHSALPFPLPLYQLSIFLVSSRVSYSSYLSKPEEEEEETIV